MEKELKVSEQTKIYIESLEQLNKQWAYTYKAVSEMYGDRQAETILREEYYDAFDKLKEVMMNLTFRSIDEKMSSISNKGEI